MTRPTSNEASSIVVVVQQKLPSSTAIRPSSPSPAMSDNPSHFVSFPTSDSVSISPLPVPHLPFRRISLPTTPSPAIAAHRHSVASLASFDSLADESVVVHQHRRAKRRSLNPAARSHRRTQVDDDRQAKRSKIISEFYATEKSYLDGLDLVYNVCIHQPFQMIDCSFRVAFSNTYPSITGYIQTTADTKRNNDTLLKLHRHLEFSSYILCCVF